MIAIAVAALVCAAVLPFLPTIVAFLCPWLHPCNRGRHVPDFRHRIRILGWGVSARNISAFVEQRNYCPRCGREYGNGWSVVDGPRQMLAGDLTPEDLAELSAGREVILEPEAGKLWE